jgi:hypothetical protein
MLVDKVAHRTLMILLVKFGISLVRSLWSGEIWDIQRKPLSVCGVFGDTPLSDGGAAGVVYGSRAG